MSLSCGPFDHVVFHGTVAGSSVAVCLWLQPGLTYGFTYGAEGDAPIVALSVEDRFVQGDFDWTRGADGRDWASVTIGGEGAGYTIRVCRGARHGQAAAAVMEIRGQPAITFDPGSVTHDLPFD